MPHDFAPIWHTAQPHELAVVAHRCMATIASTMLGLYVGCVQPISQGHCHGHLLTGHLLSAGGQV